MLRQYGSCYILNSLTKERAVEFLWISGHNTIKDNEIGDIFARLNTSVEISYI